MAIFTLWNTLQKYKVIIPIIQRDYAQGRKDDVQIEQIRKAFLKNLLDHLVSLQPLELDFVYGALKQDELELLDGQQRLTTLFLLHWYLAYQTQEQLQKSEVKKQLSRFSYQTRASSRMFIDALIQNGDQILVESVLEADKLSAVIENEAWYLAIWKKDPTVISMLTVLDEINTQFTARLDINETSAKDLWEALVHKDLLCFYLLPMNEFALSDELYIKMNARGVQLTEFENFKAWLQGNFEQTVDEQTRYDFFNHIDRAWTDYLWILMQQHNNKPDLSKNQLLNFDAMFMQFFKSCLLCQSYTLAIKKNLKTEYTNDKDEISLVSRLRKDLLITTDEYKFLLDAAVHQEFIQNISKVFNFLSHNAKEKNIQNILFNIFDSKDSSYEDQAQFSILYFYCVYINDEDQFDNWFNISKRLVNNAKNYFNAEKDLINVLDAVAYLASFIGGDDVLETMSLLSETEENFKRLSTAFDISHIRHEIEKAQLICRDMAWKPLFQCYESHAYFNGQIDFLIRYSKDENQIASMDLFEKYASIACRVFTAEILNDDQYRLHRSLLSLGHKVYLVRDGANKSFCRGGVNNVRRRNENWRKVFEGRHELLKELLDKLTPDFEIKDLEKITNENKLSIRDWRIYFIEYPETIKYCGKYQIRFINSNTIYLLSSKQMNGAHAELRTYALYLKLLENGFDQSKLQYIDVTSSSEAPYVLVKKDNFPDLSVKFVEGSLSMILLA